MAAAVVISRVAPRSFGPDSWSVNLLFRADFWLRGTRKRPVGDRGYEAQNVLYPIATCGRRAAAAARGNATMPGGDEWRSGWASQISHNCSL